jgi:hypothetical protein
MTLLWHFACCFVREGTPMKQLITAAVAVAFALPLAAQQKAGPAAEEHLNRAAQLLDSISVDKIREADDAEQEFEALQKHFADMVAAYRQNGGVPPPIDVNANDDADDDDAKPTDWRKKFSEVERKVTALVGGGPAFDGTVTAGVATPIDAPRVPAAPADAAARRSQGAGDVADAGTPSGAGTTAAASGVPGAVGTAGTGAAPGTAVTPATPATPGTPGVPATAAAPGAAVTPGTAGAASAGGAAGVAAGAPAAAVEVSTIGIEDLDAGVRQQLHDFRRELELFFVATIGHGGA